MRDDFAIFILSHGRPAAISDTINALTNARYSGRWYIVLDTEDGTADEYAVRWGAERLLVFDKDEIARTFDLADNGGPRGGAVYARNACARLAAELGLTYYMQLDDDYTYFCHRFEKGGTLTYAYLYHMDDVLEALVDFLDVSGAVAVAFAQGGDFSGGVTGGWSSVRVKRKAMNTFIARVDRPIRFVGRLNEDTTTYVWRGGQGELYLTIMDLSLNQAMTQSQTGGMTEAYLQLGTHVKSFYSVLFSPSCVKVAVLGDLHVRLHHKVSWNNAVPKIVSGALRRRPAEGGDPCLVRSSSTQS